MKFDEAKAKLAEIADGKYHSLSYELNEYSSGELKVVCQVYIADLDYCKASTWQEALDKLTEPAVKPIYKDEQPEAEA